MVKGRRTLYTPDITQLTHEQLSFQFHYISFLCSQIKGNLFVKDNPQNHNQLKYALN